MSSQPIGYQPNLAVAQNLFCAKFGHPIIALAVKARMRGVVDEIGQPFARTVSCQIRSSRIWICFVELMAIRAGDRMPFAKTDLSKKEIEILQKNGGFRVEVPNS